MRLPLDPEKHPLSHLNFDVKIYPTRPRMLSQNLTSEFRSLNRCLFPSGDLHPALEMLRRASLTPRNRLELILETQKTRVPAA